MGCPDSRENLIPARKYTVPSHAVSVRRKFWWCSPIKPEMSCLLIGKMSLRQKLSVNSTCRSPALRKCAERGSLHDCHIHLGDHNNQSHWYDPQCKKECPLLLALDIRQYGMVELRPLAWTLQSCRIGCGSAGVCYLGHCCLEEKREVIIPLMRVV